jgi:FXSXX-COOH protein
LIVAIRQRGLVTVNGGSPADDVQAEWRSDMADVSGMSLSELAAEDDDSVLAQSLRRLAADLSRPGEPIAGFNSAL